MSNVVAIPVIIVGPGLDEHARRIARVDFFGRAVDADAVGQVVFEEFIPGRPPQLGAGIGAVGKIVVGNQIVIRVDQMDAVPDAVGAVVPEDAMP